MVTVSGGILDVLTAEGEPSDILGAMENDGSNLDDHLPPTYLPPEATSPALDATFYYVLCSMVLVAAVFGNFLLVSCC